MPETPHILNQEELSELRKERDVLEKSINALLDDYYKKSKYKKEEISISFLPNRMFARLVLNFNYEFVSHEGLKKF